MKNIDLIIKDRNSISTHTGAIRVYVDKEKMVEVCLPYGKTVAMKANDLISVMFDFMKGENNA